ncbi:vesicle-associated membrane protein 2 [Marmota marmota marmota]|uniref:vesicle-associated membrane protein 2 n=1 Tax=Marmota marmota marmota TaxID=9994 RepID=UPI002092CAFF|nr:vesicle-associated membrane protein 2 [Marmota marmota marmota]
MRIEKFMSKCGNGTAPFHLNFETSSYFKREKRCDLYVAHVGIPGKFSLEMNKNRPQALGLNPFLLLRSATAATAPPAAPAGEGGPPAPPPNLTSNRRLQQTQAQVDEVVDIMRVNVDKVLERDQKLSELDDRADALQAGASQFETSAAKLKRKYWWKNLKMMIILGVICAIILIIIIVYFST